jgi:hypothetical protein
MSSEPVKIRSRVAFSALLVSMLCGGAVVFAQAKSSAFYSDYDARQLVRDRKYKGIDCAYGDIGSETISELQGGGSEKTKSISYGCRIQATGGDAFNVADFLNWLAEETEKRIESGEGVVVRRRHKVGRRFYIEYTQNGFAGRVEVDGDAIGEGQMSLDVEIIESSKNWFLFKKNPAKESGPQPLPYCEVARNPELHNGKVIRVRATLSFGSGGMYVIEDCDPVSALASLVELEGSEQAGPKARNYVDEMLTDQTEFQVKKIDTIIVGRFDGEFSTGCWLPKYRIAATSIEKVSP